MGIVPIPTYLPAGQRGCRSIPEWVSRERERESKIYSIGSSSAFYVFRRRAFESFVLLMGTDFISN